MRLIEEWLHGDSKNFIIGRAIYKVMGGDENLKRLFAAGETQFATIKLLNAITGLNEPKSHQPGIIDIPLADAVEMDVEDSDDPVLISLTASWKPKYARMNLLRHKLDEYADNNSQEAVAACGPLCKEILELEKEITALWKQRDHYREHGSLPEVKTKQQVLPENPFEAAKIIGNIKSNIRRYKALTRNNPAEPKYAQMHQDYLQQYKQITGEDYKEKK